MNNLTVLCAINICQNNGKCILLANHTTSYCLCNKCFTGNQCEIQQYSKNLWIYGMSEENKKAYNPYNETIVLVILGIISLISNLLSLQTFLFSRNIRITNLGIYLILYSLTGLIVSIIQSVFALMNLIFNFKETSKLNHLIQCACMRVVLQSLIFCLYWFWLYIAIERILIEYSFVNLYDSRRRSIISCILLYILLPLSNLLPILFGRKDYNYNSYDFCLLNFTTIGYTFYIIFDYFNYITSPLSFTIACIFIFKHLIKHRRSLINDESFRSSLVLIGTKHYDFFLPPLIYCILISPQFIFDKLMNCLRANSIVVSRIQTATELISNSSLAVTFFIYVYLSKVYYEEFWQKSPFGRFLIYVKKRFINSSKPQISIFTVAEEHELMVSAAPNI